MQMSDAIQTEWNMSVTGIQVVKWKESLEVWKKINMWKMNAWTQLKWTKKKKKTLEQDEIILFHSALCSLTHSLIVN